MLSFWEKNGIEKYEDPLAKILKILDMRSISFKNHEMEMRSRVTNTFGNIKDVRNHKQQTKNQKPKKRKPKTQTENQKPKTTNHFYF